MLARRDSRSTPRGPHFRSLGYYGLINHKAALQPHQPPQRPRRRAGNRAAQRGGLPVQSLFCFLARFKDGDRVHEGMISGGIEDLEQVRLFYQPFQRTVDDEPAGHLFLIKELLHRI